MTANPLEEPIRKALGDEGFDIIKLTVTERRQIKAILDLEPGGIRLDDLVRASRAVEAALDKVGYDAKSFDVSMNSPGVDRLLTRPKDFLRFEGSDIKVKLNKVIGGRKTWRGKLLGWMDGVFEIQPVDGGRRQGFPLVDAAEVRIVPQF